MVTGYRKQETGNRDTGYRIQDIEYRNRTQDTGILNTKSKYRTTGYRKRNIGYMKQDDT